MVLGGRDLGKSALVDTMLGVGVRDIGTACISTVSSSETKKSMNLQADISVGSSSSNQSLPGVGTLPDHFIGVPSHESALRRLCQSKPKNTHFLFLHSPEKANWFSGFPSGIL